MIKQLRSIGKTSTNESDITYGLLQRNHIHTATCDEGTVPDTLAAFRKSPETEKQNAKFILATDGKSFEAENIPDGETVACEYPASHDHFGFFLPLGGITTVKQIRENAFGNEATSRINKLNRKIRTESAGKEPKERFLVPFPAIEEMIEKLKDGTIEK